MNVINDELILYINLIENHYKPRNNYKLIQQLLQEKFNIEIEVQQIEKYYYPNINELKTDYVLQFKHLGLL